jgi:hypothetical protein
MVTAVGVSEAIARQLVDEWDREVRRTEVGPTPIALAADDA